VTSSSGQQLSAQHEGQTNQSKDKVYIIINKCVQHMQTRQPSTVGHYAVSSQLQQSTTVGVNQRQITHISSSSDDEGEEFSDYAVPPGNQSHIMQLIDIVDAYDNMNNSIMHQSCVDGIMQISVVAEPNMVCLNNNNNINDDLYHRLRNLAI
jgi:hypothetical protein